MWGFKLLAGAVGVLGPHEQYAHRAGYGQRRNKALALSLSQKTLGLCKFAPSSYPAILALCTAQVRYEFGLFCIKPNGRLLAHGVLEFRTKV